MGIDAVVWTEGKTDSQYLARASELLSFPYNLDFAVSDDMGDDALLKQCIALARVPQSHPTIFIFDRDNPEILSKVNDHQASYKSWENNVFSFAIPIPDHRPGTSYACIELYFSDDDLRIKDSMGRRLFLSSEFNANSGRHLTISSLSVAHKGKLVIGRGGSTRILDTEVYDETHKNVALSKADFAHNIIHSVDAFANVNFDQFKKTLAVIEEIVGTLSIDPVFRGLGGFIDEISELEKPAKLASTIEAAIRMCKLYACVFAGTTLRYYDPATSKFEVNLKRLRPIHQIIIENFTLPSLSTLAKTAGQCCHLVDHHAPDLLQDLRATLLNSLVLGSIGDLFDDVERVIPPDARRGRTIVKRGTKKQLLEYVFSELAKYENRISEIRDADSDTLDGADASVWTRALTLLADWMAPLRAFGYRVGNIVRLEADADKFVVNFITFRNGRESNEEVVREYADLSGDRLETHEIRASTQTNEPWVEIFPFITVKDGRLHFYSRTRAVGYEYRPAFGTSVHVVPTKRKFSHAALEGAVAADRQILFWTRVAPAVSGGGVRANIPAHDPNAFVGRKQQLATIFEEVIEIPNENGLLYGPGGIGKTALLIEISRKIFDEGLPASAPFKNVIWVSAKKDYYDPTLDVIEAGTQQFKSLDQILVSILEFHEFQEPDRYARGDQRWLVLELLEGEKTLLILDNFETISKAAQDEIIRFFGTEVKRHLRNKPDNFNC